MTEPAPVVVANPDPIDVKVAARPDTSEQSQARIVAAKAAAEADILTTEGQRGINRLWERTQAIIAIATVLVALAVIAVLIITPVLRDKEPDPAALVLLGSLVTGVSTSYFQRTNHTKIGGVGSGSAGRGE